MVLLTPIINGVPVLEKGLFISLDMGKAMAEKIQSGDIRFSEPLLPVHIPFENTAEQFYGMHDHLAVDIEEWQQLGLPLPYRSESLTQKKLIIFPMQGLGDQLYLAVAIDWLKKRYPDVSITIAKSGLSSAQQWYPFIYHRHIDHYIGPVTTVSEMKTHDFFIDAETFAHLPGYAGTYPPRFYFKTLFHQTLNEAHALIPEIAAPPVPEAIKAFVAAIRHEDMPLLFINSTSTGRVRDLSDKTVLEFLHLIDNTHVAVVSTFKKPALAELIAAADFRHAHVTQGLVVSAQDLIGLISEMDLVLTTDSGITHLAETLKKPCASIFNVVTPDERIGPYHFAESAMLEFEIQGICKTPCYVHALKDRDLCPGMKALNENAEGQILFYDYPPCMENLTGEHLLQILSSIDKPRP